MVFQFYVLQYNPTYIIRHFQRIMDSRNSYTCDEDSLEILYILKSSVFNWSFKTEFSVSFNITDISYLPISTDMVSLNHEQSHVFFLKTYCILLYKHIIRNEAIRYMYT